MIIDFDIPTIIYAFCCLVSAYGFGLFAWWWKRIGSATEVYAYVTFLFLGILITAAIGIYSRYLHVVNERHYDTFVDSVWWGLGPMLVLAVLCAIVIRMTRRIYILRRGTIEEVSRELRLMICPHCGKPCPRWEAEEAKRARERSE